MAGTEPDNAVATAFDARDLATAVTRGVGSAQASTWNTGHDANGNPVSMTDAVNDDVTPGPETEQTFHDGFDRVVRRLDRAGNERQRVLDPGGRVVHTEAFGPVDGTSVVAVLLASADFLFDEAGQLFQADRDLFLPAGAVTSHGQTRVDGALTPGDNKVSRRREHDALARLTFLVDDHGFVTGFEYDGADRRIRVVLPLENAMSLVKNDIVNTFDFNGNLVQRVSTHIDPRGITPARVLTSYFAQTGTITVPVVLIGAAAVLLSLGQRRLSTPVRLLRRHAIHCEGRLLLDDGTEILLSLDRLRAAPEGALRAHWIGLALLAGGLVAWRLI